MIYYVGFVIVRTKIKQIIIIKLISKKNTAKFLIGILKLMYIFTQNLNKI